LKEIGVKYIVKNITTRNKLKVDFENNDKLWQITLDAMSESVFLIDLEHKILQCNKATLDILGKSNFNEIIGHSCWELVHCTTAPINWCPVNRMRQTGQRESTVQILNGRWVEISVEPVFSDEGEITGAVHIITDISARKKAEDDLSESEQQYLTILNSLSDAMHVVDRDLKIIFQNPAMIQWLEQLNLSSDLISKTIFEAFPFLDYNKVYNEYDKVFNDRELLITTEAVKLFDRNVFTETLKIPMIREGEVSHIITILRDITDQKEAEQKLRASEEKYRYLIENAFEGVWVIDSNADTVLVNPSMAHILGYSAEEMIGESLFSFMDEKAVKITKNHLEKRKQGISEERDAEMIHKNDKKVFLRIRPTPIFNHLGEYEGTYAFLANIIQRKSAEQKLKESEKKFRNLFENSPNIIILLDQKGVILDFNQLFLNKFNFEKKELVGKDFRDILRINSGNTLTAVEQYKKLIQNGKVEPFELGITNVEGKQVWINLQASEIEISNQHIIQVILQDITEKKFAETELKESEEKFRIIAEQSFMGIIILQNGVFKYFNEQAAKMNGYSMEEIRNWEPYEFQKLIYPDDRDFVMAQVRKKQAGEPDVFSHYQYRVIKKNGEVIWVENFSKTINYGGRPADFVMTIDIDDKIKSDQKLKESEENFRTIAEQAFIGTLIIQDDKVEYVNNALLQIFEYSHEVIDNWRKNDLIKLIYPEDLQYLREYRKKLRAGESDIKEYYSYRVFTKYGKIKWIDQFSRPIIYRGQQAEIVTIMDITEKKKAEEELRKLNTLKSELLRRTSHELKTPLVSIKGFSDLLLTVHKDKLDDYVLATIHEIKLGCERLENLIQDILKTAELESESVELKKSEEDISFLIKLCVKELQGLIRLRNHNINLEIHDKLITRFEPDQIHLVLSNLLNNAIKYTPPNGKIKIKTDQTNDTILISIQDNGIGITNEEKKRLFSQFGKIERYGQGLDIISDGSGLGLFITKKIIELHGGKIWVRSKGRNKGSTFYFTLPLITQNKE